MSLLMDALKKAELAKRQGRGEDVGAPAETDAPGGLALEPIPVVLEAESQNPPAAAESTPPSTKLPHLPSHLEELDAQFLAEATQAAAARLKPQPPTAPVRAPITDQPAVVKETAPRADTDAPHHRATVPVKPRQPPNEQPVTEDKSAAQNLFAAKQVDKPPARKTFAVVIGVMTVLSVSGIGGYFWWQLQPKSTLVAGGALPSPQAPAKAPAPVAVVPAPTLAVAPVTPIAAPPSVVRPTASAEEDKDDDAPAAAKAPVQPRRASPPATAPAEADGPIRLTKAPLKVNPALLRGFDAFNRGDLATAQTEYERARKSDPRNTDALHGLAAIAIRQGNPDQAEWLYRQITEADPHDTVAMSALINSRAQIDPNAAESRLKSMSAAQPELAAPHFSLGNLYARHGRWEEAQQAYFRAYSAEPDNPDIVYNLAISLEHLRQNKLAAQYYGQAIAAAQKQAAGFDPAQVAARLHSLQP